MPNESVVVTGADGHVGHLLLTSLSHAPYETIAITRTGDEPPSKIISDSLTSVSAEKALRDADYIVHLAGALRPLGKNTYEKANIETTRIVAKALKKGRAKRVVFLSYVGANENSQNLYLRQKAMAERMLQESGKEVVVYRCSYIIGTPDNPGSSALGLMSSHGKPVLILGTGRQIVAPVFVGDVVSAIVRALDYGVPGIYELIGPDRMTMDDLVRLLNGPNIRVKHFGPVLAILLSMIVPSLPRPLVETLLADSVGDSSEAVRNFKLELTSLTSIWRQTRNQAA